MAFKVAGSNAWMGMNNQVYLRPESPMPARAAPRPPVSPPNPAYKHTGPPLPVSPLRTAPSVSRGFARLDLRPRAEIRKATYVFPAKVIPQGKSVSP